MDFRKYLEEAVEKTAVMAFGRFNPPTVGHEKLIQKVRDEADERSGTGHVFASHSELTRKDPLPQDAKIGYLNQIAHGTEIHGSSKKEPTFLHAAAKLYAAGHKHLVMIAGSDRVQEYQEKLDKYNDGKVYPHGKFKFKSIKVVSAGQRDPDAEGVEGISGTKMREYARGNKHKKFESGLPEGLKDNAKAIGDHIRAIKDDVKEGLDITNKVDVVREAYLNNLIYKIGDVVEAKNGDKGPIVFRGSTYVTIQLSEGKTIKHWLKNIQEATKVWPEITVKPARRILEKQIPALFMSKKQLEERSNDSMEVEYQGYYTENLHMCPGASENLKDLIKKQDLNPKYVLQAIQATDKYLGVEKEAKKLGFADSHLVHQFNMYLAIAHDTLNMLGYPDASLMYMGNHIKDMALLSIHKDSSFSNETISTIPTFGMGDAAESYIPQVKEKITMDKLRKRIAEVRNSVKENNQPPMANADSYPLDPPTAHRDINLTSDKEVYHGIDKTIEDQGYPGKPPGLVSFKSFLATPETQKIEKEKGEHMQDVHRAKAELSTHSSAYRSMAKASQMGH